MTARKQNAKPDEPVVQRPPYWIADVPLPVAAEMGGEAIGRAFHTGDPVPAEHVERYHWQQYVHAPDGDWPPAEVPPAEPEPGSQKE